jgi:DNA-directed RNA polymerase subunit RPC12/RpoP
MWENHDRQPVSHPTAERRLCPHPEYDAVVCPACGSEIRGVIPDGTPDDPAARCPACDTVIESVLTPE